MRVSEVFVGDDGDRPSLHHAVQYLEQENGLADARFTNYHEILFKGTFDYGIDMVIPYAIQMDVSTEVARQPPVLERGC